MSATHWTFGSVRVTRIPYFDIGLPADSLGLDAGEVQGLGDAASPWVDETGQPVVGQAFWVIESEGEQIVMDPCGASDAFLRTGPEAIGHQDAAFGAFTAAGFDRHAVDLVVLSHLDGIGMVALLDEDGNWSPAFPNARVLVSESEHASIVADPGLAGQEAFMALDAQGVVATITPPHQLTAEITLVPTGGHTLGHLVAQIGSGDVAAVLIGHLAVSPLDLLTPETSPLHLDRDAAGAQITTCLQRAHSQDAVLFGPLWPAPGAVRVQQTDPVQIVGVPGQTA